MNRKKVIGLCGFIVLGGVVAVIVDALIGWRPRSGLEERFQNVIADAQIEDSYRWSEGGGWDSEDVTDQVCDHVDLKVLQSMGMGVKPYWPMPIDGMPSRPVYSWEIKEDAGLLAACRKFSLRYLKIVIDAETLACAATVSAMPTCDL